MGTKPVFQKGEKYIMKLLKKMTAKFLLFLAGGCCSPLTRLNRCSTSTVPNAVGRARQKQTAWNVRPNILLQEAEVSFLQVRPGIAKIRYGPHSKPVLFRRIGRNTIDLPSPFSTTPQRRCRSTSSLAMQKKHSVRAPISIIGFSPTVQNNSCWS